MTRGISTRSSVRISGSRCGGITFQPSGGTTFWVRGQDVTRHPRIGLYESRHPEYPQIMPLIAIPQTLAHCLRPTPQWYWFRCSRLVRQLACRTFPLSHVSWQKYNISLLFCVSSPTPLQFKLIVSGQYYVCPRMSVPWMDPTRRSFLNSCG